MTAKKVKPDTDTSTEEKIKNAARVVFHKKGFAATRTRDIAQEAGINLALLNYYFRSKQKLFDIIMLETLQGFMQSMAQVFNNDRTSLEEKVRSFAERYIDLLIQEPGIPLFILNELSTNPSGLIQKMSPRELLMRSHFVKQYQQAYARGTIAKVNFMHFLINTLALTVFPFVGAPLLKAVGDLKDEQYNKLMMERKALIPVWVKSMLKTK